MHGVDREQCEAWDRDDPLREARSGFELPEDVIYLDGNSLGALPVGVAQRLDEVVRREWGRDLIRSWNVNDWMTLPQRVGEKIGAHLGAEPGEVVVADSTSVNLFKLLAAALELRPDRRVILTESGNFPTDLYVAQGLARLLDRGHEVRAVDRDALVDHLRDDVAVLMLTQVDYRTGQVHDMRSLTATAHAAGALTLWDLSHSAGALPVDLGAAGADFAVGCGYKYLNGGPGAPAFLFVAGRHQEAIHPPLSGWMGHAAPFEFSPDYRPAGGIARHLCGTPPVLGVVALDCGLERTLGWDPDQVRAKSMRLGDLFIALVRSECAGFGFEPACPLDAGERGSQVTFHHPEGYAIVQALIARGVIGDFRAPDILRFGFAPLYVGYRDVWDAVSILADVMRERAWDRPEFQSRAAVT